MNVARPKVIRFGVFEVDLRSGELFKEGRKIKIEDQPFLILSILLENPGEVVSRKDLQQRIWPQDTFVDFDHGLNIAIQKLRLALGDSSENPKFVGTLPRRGYRFIYPVDNPPPEAFRLPSSPSPSWIARVWSLMTQSPTPIPLAQGEVAKPVEFELPEIEVSPGGNPPEALQAKEDREGGGQLPRNNQLEVEPPQRRVAEVVIRGSPLTAGQRLGPYEVLSLLGKGGMGEVYLASDIRLDRQVAQKVLPVEFTEDPERLRRFLQEAKAASGLNHPNIATIYEIGESDGINWIAMELVEGETLSERIAVGADPRVRPPARQPGADTGVRPYKSKTSLTSVFR